MKKRSIYGLIIALVIIGLTTAKAAMTQDIQEILNIPVEPIGQETTLVSVRPVKIPNITKPIIITAYSSRVQETDSTPFITASGKYVADGFVAANWLPIGAQVRIPKLFGEKIFTVEDRMAKKNSDKLDIWFASTSDAIRFGVKTAEIEIL